MGSSWMSTGYEAVAEEEKRREDAKESGGEGDGKPWRLWMPPGETKRILMVSDQPSNLWEHQLKIKDDWRNWAVCLKKNGLADTCPACKDEKWPSFVGLFTGLDLTGYVPKKHPEKRYVGQRRIIAAKLGGKDKPGMLKELERLKKKYGRLNGLVFDAYRSGEKCDAIGDRWDLVDKIDPTVEAMREYVVKVCRDTEGADWDEKRNPIEVIKYTDWIKPMSVSAFMSWMHGRSSDEEKGEAKGEAKSEASGSEGDTSFNY